MLLFDLVVLAYAIVTILVQGVAVVLALRMPRRDPLPPGDAGSADPVAVVIAARNEAGEIGPCLDALRAQVPAPSEIVVVDGGSTDSTAEEARQRPGVTVLSEPPMPAGWVGKNWACWTGGRATTAPLLLFLDADVILRPGALGAALDWMRTERADLVTFAPRIVMEGAWERLVLPFYTQMVLTYFRAPHVNRPDSNAAMVNGQFYLVRRAAYDAVGGHRAVAGFVLEDVAMARRFRAAGMTMRVAWAPELLTTRMYRDRREMFEGLLKNVHDTEFRTGRQLAFLLGIVGFFLLPLAILPLGLLGANLPLIAIGSVLWILLFGKHAIFARSVGGRVRDGLGFPVAAGFYVALLLASLRRGWRGEALQWKGRKYALTPGDGSPPTP